jgi:hypothetical protein
MLAQGLVGEPEIAEATAAHGLANDRDGNVKAYLIAMRYWEKQVKASLAGYVSDEQFIRCMGLVGAEDASPLPDLPGTD